MSHNQSYTSLQGKNGEEGDARNKVEATGERGSMPVGFVDGSSEAGSVNTDFLEAAFCNLGGDHLRRRTYNCVQHSKSAKYESAN